MINVEKVLLAAANDKMRYAANPLGPGYLTRNERWSEVIRYALDKTEKAALRISMEWRPSRQEIENLAIEQAALNGRDWIDCGAYEREAYMDEARKLLGIDK